jgi:hypothetical protein
LLHLFKTIAHDPTTGLTIRQKSADVGFILLGLAVAVILFSGAAVAHNWWGGGKEVDENTKSQCCGQNDCHEIDSNLVRTNGAGYDIDLSGFEWFFPNRARGKGLIHVPQERVAPSRDGSWWVCYLPGEHDVRCVFGAFGA